jgi:hypothetical protein
LATIIALRAIAGHRDTGATFERVDTMMFVAFGGVHAG